MNRERKIADKFRELLIVNARMKSLPPPNLWVEEIGGKFCVVKDKGTDFCTYHPTSELVERYAEGLRRGGSRKKKGYRGPGRYSGKRR